MAHDSPLEAPQRSPVPHRVIGYLSGVALAGPAAISVLGELTSKLDLSDILTRIVLDFRHVSSEFWRLLFSYLPFKIALDPHALTLATLIVLPTALQKPTLKGTNDGEIYIGFSLTFTYLLCLFFGDIRNIGYLIFISVLFSFGVFSTVSIKPIIFTNVWFFIRGAFWFSLVLVFLPVLDGTTIKFDIPISSLIVMAFVVFYSVRKIVVGSPGPLNMVLVALGIYGVDWFCKIAKPAIEMWLTQIGA